MNSIQDELKTIKHLRATASKDEQLGWLLANCFPQKENGFRSYIDAEDPEDLQPQISSLIDAIYFKMMPCPNEWKIYEDMIRDVYKPYFIEVTPLQDNIKWKHKVITASNKRIPGKFNVPAKMTLLCGSFHREMDIVLIDECLDN